MVKLLYGLPARPDRVADRSNERQYGQPQEHGPDQRPNLLLAQARALRHGSRHRLGGLAPPAFQARLSHRHQIHPVLLVARPGADGVTRRASGALSPAMPRAAEPRLGPGLSAT